MLYVYVLRMNKKYLPSVVCLETSLFRNINKKEFKDQFYVQIYEQRLLVNLNIGQFLFFNVQSCQNI